MKYTRFRSSNVNLEIISHRHTTLIIEINTMSTLVPYNYLSMYNSTISHHLHANDIIIKNGSTWVHWTKSKTSIGNLHFSILSEYTCFAFELINDKNWILYMMQVTLIWKSLNEYENLKHTLKIILHSKKITIAIWWYTAIHL